MSSSPPPERPGDKVATQGRPPDRRPPDRRPPDRRPPKRRALRLVALLPLLLVGVYFGAVYLFLNTPLGPWAVNRKPEKFAMTWESGSMTVPGRVTVRGLRLDGHTPRGDWGAQVDEAELHIDHFAVLQKRLRVTEAMARGCRGFWQTRPKDQGAAPQVDRPPGRWDFHFDGVQIEDLRELRVDANRLVAGDRPGQGRFALQLRPRRHVAVPELELRLEQGRVFIDDEDQGVLDVLAVEGRLDPLVPREHKGTDWVRFVSAEVEVRAEAWSLSRSLGATARVLGPLPVSVGGVGGLDAAIQVHRGHLRPGSRLAVDGDRVSLDYLGYRGAGAGRLGMHVDDELHLDLELEDFTVSQVHLGEYIKGHGLRLQAASPALDLTHPTPTARATVLLPASQIPDFGVYGQYLPSGTPIRLDAGRGEIEARFDFHVEPDRAPFLTGRLELSGKNVEGLYKEERLRGNVFLTTDIEGELTPQLGRQNFFLRRMALNVDEVYAVDDSRSPPWWARVEMPEAYWVVGRKLEISADLTAAISDSRPLIALVLEKRSMPGWMERFLSHRGVAVTSRLRLDEKRLVLRDLNLQGGRHLSAEAELSFDEGALAGLALISWRRFSMAAELGPEPGRRDLDWIGAKTFFNRRESIWEQRIDRVDP